MDPCDFLGGRVQLYAGDCLDAIKLLSDASVDAVVSDPPYGIVFMGRKWDTAGPEQRAFATEFWREVYRVLKPGGHVLAFAATRTSHRLTCAIEDAGFEIRDLIMWVYGSGFPKSLNVSKAIDKALGAERAKVRKDGAPAYQRGIGNHRPWMDDPGHRVDSDEPSSAEAAQWQGWGTALKPALEPITMARKPLDGTVARNVLAHGTGALNIDACRVGSGEVRQSNTGGMGRKASPVFGAYANASCETVVTTEGRWPANLIHDGSDEAVAAFPDSQSGAERGPRGTGGIWSESSGSPCGPQYGDTGSAARFFYTAKADADDRLGSAHPTVKPVDLMRYLVRLVTPPGGLVLDPFAGTGTTGEAAWREGMRAVLFEREPGHIPDIERRMGLVLSGSQGRRAAAAKAREECKPASALGGMFAGLDEQQGGAARGAAIDSSTAASHGTNNRADRIEEVMP